MATAGTENLTVRINSDVKHKAMEYAEAIGMPLTTVVSVMLTRFVADGGFPFDVCAPEAPNARTRAAIREVELAYENGEAMEQSVDDFFAEMGVK